MAFISISSIIEGVSPIYGNTTEESVKIWGSPDLSKLTSDLVSTYLKSNPEAKISFVSVPADQMDEMISAEGNIGLVTKEYLHQFSEKAFWKMQVGRDIIVAVMNPENPFREELNSKGMSAEDFIKLVGQGKNPDWNSIADVNKSIPVRCWISMDESVLSSLSEFTGIDKKSLQFIQAKGMEDFLTEIQKDKYAIGFCQLAKIINPKTQLIDPRIVPIPIDIDGNNSLDYMENIYSGPGELERGVWIGKYPKKMYSNIYSLSSGAPDTEDARSFMRWVLTDGQQCFNAMGYSELILSERNSRVLSLYPEPLTPENIVDESFHAGTVLFFIAMGTGLLLIFFGLFGYTLKGRKKPISISPAMTGVFGDKSVKAPEGLFFDKSHTWTFMEKDGMVRTGIDDFLQHVTGSITKIKLRGPGEKIKKGETFLIITQHGKQLEIKSPVSGIIMDNNSGLKTESSLVNSTPYSEGWVYLIKPSDWIKETRAFIMGETYRSWLRNEVIRLKEFISSRINPQLSGHEKLVMQDGGEIRSGLLENFGPDVWEEFQTRFIEKS